MMEDDMNGQSTSIKRENLQREAIDWLNEAYPRLTNISRVRNLINYLSYLMIIVVIPSTVAAFHPSDSSSKSIQEFQLTENIDLIFPVIFILFSLKDILYVRDFTKDRILFEELQEYFKQQGIDTGIKLDIQNTNVSKMINQLQLAYIAGTFFVVSLWYMFPDHGRLEPLAILYGFGTGLFGYFRTKLSINSSIDRFINGF